MTIAASSVKWPLQRIHTKLSQPQASTLELKRDDLDEDGEDEIHHVWKEELLVVTTVIDD